MKDVVSGFRESFPRSFVSRIRVALACCGSSSCCGDEDVGVSDGFQVCLIVFLSSGHDVKVVGKHSRDCSSFLHLWNPWSDQQSSERQFLIRKPSMMLMHGVRTRAGMPASLALMQMSGVTI